MALKDLSFTRGILPAAALLGLVGAMIFVSRGLPDHDSDLPEEPERGVTVDRGPFRVAGTGVVEPSSESIAVGAALAGLVAEVFVTPGDHVSRGQPLFTVDTRALRSRLKESQAAEQEALTAIAEARANVEDARAGERIARRQLELYQAVDEAAAVSRAEVIRAEGDVSAAEGKRDLAEARLAATQSRYEAEQVRAESARVELDRATARAPISGEILAVNIRPGEFLSNQGAGGAKPFVEMGATHPLHVRIDVDEAQAPLVALGSPATVSPRGAEGAKVTAVFVRAEPVMVPKRSLTNSANERVDVRVLQLIYRLPPASGLFRVGQQVDAYMPATQRRRVKNK
ncbi:HlyD family secretion protein [Croceibacterium ferulae]|uniref:HlyD family secretion protein n=1 Tax=Croceibacterium ferulae TaxID=1854641 RepID=UPI000EB377EC|nr:efflux RND transporter periplasmic adaptor subunit [Croceibacterium ferulae]